MLWKSDIRYKLMIVWVVAFLMVWVIFYSSFNMLGLEKDLDKIIECVENKDWNQAKTYTDKFTKSFFDKKYLIQVNNATEIFTTFEPAVRQMELSVKNKQESALEYAGYLKEGLNFVVKPFSGP